MLRTTKGTINVNRAATVEKIIESCSYILDKFAQFRVFEPPLIISRTLAPELMSISYGRGISWNVFMKSSFLSLEEPLFQRTTHCQACSYFERIRISQFLLPLLITRIRFRKIPNRIGAIVGS